MQAINDFSFSAPAPSPAPAEDNASTAASDFQSFLMLLTAQLRNQDPLSPLDSTQFVEQLASFSAVEQQIETNSRLEALTESLTGGALEEASQWVGQHVETVSGAARFEGEALRYVIPAGEEGASTEVVVSDLAGNIVYRQDVDNTRQEFLWRGETNDGATAPNGDYVVSIQRYDESGPLGASSPIALTAVLQARFEEGGVNLVLANGAVVDPAAISALRAAPADET
jgi:flagellar basal-body rod modification protein FlgD